MTRIPRIHLVLCIVAILALVSAPLASAGPRETSPPAHRTDDGWFGAALRWLEDAVGFHHSSSGRATSSPNPMQKDGGNGNTPTGGSCIEPQGKPWCL
jgi:hypothetical protein